MGLLIRFVLGAQSLQSCPTHCNPMDGSSPGSSVHGILQSKMLEVVACFPPGNLPDPGIQPVYLMSPAFSDGFFTTDATWGLANKVKELTIYLLAVLRCSAVSNFL